MKGYRMGRRKVKTILFFVILVSSLLLLVNNRGAKAAATNALPIQEVADIDNYPYPSTKTVNVVTGNVRNFLEFTIESPGQVKVFLRGGLESSGKGSAWISRDVMGVDNVGDFVDFTGRENEISWFLEPGSYYFNVIWNQYQSEVRIAALFEPANSDEIIMDSTFGNSNEIKLKKTYNGFLSLTRPNDYYSFKITEKTNVTITYSFDALNNKESDIGLCSLYNSDKLFKTGGTFDRTIQGSKQITYLLEPDTYYIKLNGMYGKTTLQVAPMYYHINLNPEITEGWVDEPIEVSIETSIEYSEIMVLFKDITESLIDSNNLWNLDSEHYVKVDGESFKATKSGIYSVRITDKYGNHTLKKINISNIDITKPKVTGVKDKKSYNKAVTIKWTDKHSGIDTTKTTLNGKKVTSGTKVTKEGEYTLKVYDKMGNYKKVVFYIDFTPPTAGVKNGATYNRFVTLKFKDNVSGIKKIVVDDMEQSIEYRTMSLYLDGEYVIELWDNAGNYHKIEFKIKSKY